MDFYTYKASLETKRGIGSVYDGDTISNLVIDMGFKIKYKKQKAIKQGIC